MVTIPANQWGNFVDLIELVMTIRDGIAKDSQVECNTWTLEFDDELTVAFDKWGDDEDQRTCFRSNGSDWHVHWPSVNIAIERLTRDRESRQAGIEHSARGEECSVNQIERDFGQRASGHGAIMELGDRIQDIRQALAESHSAGDWRQRVAHPEEYEAEDWGSSDVIAENPSTGKWEHIARVGDSGNMKLLLAMRKHIEALIEAVEKASR